MHRLVLCIQKIIVSTMIAFIALTAFCFFYYNVPVHETCLEGCTDYKWQANKFYSRGTEGFAWGKTNNEGYKNGYDFNGKNYPLILILGSSHMEAYQVAMDENVVSRLNAMFGNNVVYNLGISGHDFLRCFSNMHAAVKRYKPSKYVIFENTTLHFQIESLKAAVDGSFQHIPSYSTGILAILQRNQFLRLLYKQFKELKKEKTAKLTNNQEENIAEYKEYMNSLLHKVQIETVQNGIKAIIVYHPGIELNRDGSLNLPDDNNHKSVFAELCKKNGVIFLDMTERFTKEYKIQHKLPHGFVNSPVGKGHLNKFGHNLIAEEVYKIIEERK